MRKPSVSLRLMGSRPNSSEPVRDTTPTTSGTRAISACWKRVSIAMDSSRLMEGSFSSCTIMLPSSMVGMKVLPTWVYSAAAASIASRAMPNTMRLWRKAQSSTGM